MAAVAFWLAVWQLGSVAAGQPLIFPGPVEVLASLARSLGTARLWAAAAWSAVRILGGGALAYALGFALAGLSSRFPAVRVLLRPLLSAVKATPVVCVVVLLLIWLGAGWVSMAAVFLMALPGVYFSSLEGLDRADARLRELFDVHGVRGLRRLLAFTWPQMLPFAIAAGESIVGMSWKAGVAAELIGMPQGSIGERIYQSKLLLETADLFAWTLVVIALSWVCERAFLGTLRASEGWSLRAALRLRGVPGADAAVRAGAGPGARGGVSLEGVTVAFDGVPVLDGVTVEVDPGRRLCVMAPSGAGKTTLLRTVAGLQEVAGGSVCAEGPCAMEFQEARLLEHASVLDNVLLFARPGVGEGDVRGLLAELLPGVDAGVCVRDLSGGQRRRVELARALAAPGKRVLLDEPFAGLDERAHRAAAEVVLGHLGGRALVVATHDADDAQLLAADVLALGA